jgi:mannose-6-phosphate isomerase
MRLLDSPVRGYAWGSRTAIAALQGRPTPSPGPEAELWLGAHPSAPSVLADSGQRLDEALAGAGAPRLPFLLKVLAAAQPLSLQAHPDAAQAAAGFAAEEAAGVPRDAPNRTYVDAHHKPELLVAVEEFDALCGFRPPAESAALLAALDVPELAPIVAALRGPDPEEALRTAVTAILLHPDPKGLVAAVAPAALASAGAAGLASELADRYPDDVGVVLALLLNRVTLAPTEAVFMPAGNLHAYLRGVGVEIMAASDNVIRGGLTPKPVNVKELLRILRFEVLVDPVVRPVEVPGWPGVVTWPVPVRDFTLYRAVVPEGGAAGGGEVRLPGRGPRVVLCLRGSVTADDGAGPVTLTGGRAAFAAAGAGPVVVTGSGEVYEAAPGE